jgi:hypothetical protein
LFQHDGADLDVGRPDRDARRCVERLTNRAPGFVEALIDVFVVTLCTALLDELGRQHRDQVRLVIERACTRDADVGRAALDDVAQAVRVLRALR